MRGGLSAQRASGAVTLGGVQVGRLVSMEVPAEPVLIAESWSLPIDAVERWLKSAKPGETLVYAVGPAILDVKLAQRMNALAADGQVRIHPRRSPTGVLERVAIRNRVAVTTLRTKPGPVLDAAMSGVLMQLKEAARRGLRCPSDLELSKATGLSKGQVKWAILGLKRKQLIRTRTVPVSPQEPKYRVVTIVATGAETLAPAVRP